jgi:hypothetical protein
MKPVRTLALLCAGLGCAGLASAAPMAPLGYDMPNGGSDPFNGHYWDDKYPSPNSTTDYVWLSGGQGDLTDGVIATQNWNQVEGGSGGPYVGWAFRNPEIFFHFHYGTLIQGITFHVDDSNGAGGVSVPASFVINGVTYNVADPAGFAPTSFSFSNLNLSILDTPLTITINRRDSWLFVSEITFEGYTVPEPGSLALFGLGGALLSLRRRHDRPDNNGLAETQWLGSPEH